MSIQQVQVSPKGKISGVGNYHVPGPEGMLLPQRVTLPTIRSTKTEIVEVANSMGLDIPFSLNKQRYLERVRDRLTHLGYQHIGENVYETQIPIQLVESSMGNLPRTINHNVFLTLPKLKDFIKYYNLDNKISVVRGRTKPEIEADLRKLLSDLGYQLDESGNYQKFSNIEQLYTIRNLVSPDSLASFLKDGHHIQVLPDDLLRLNDRLPNLIKNHPRSQWSSLDHFAKDVSPTLNVSPDVAKLALIAVQSPRMSKSDLQTVMIKLGHPMEGTKKSHLKVVMSMIRPKLQLVTRDLKTVPRTAGPAPSTKTLGQAIVEGYSFEPNQYYGELRELLNDHWVPNNYLQAFTDLVQTKPEFYTLVHYYKWDDENVVNKLIRLYYQDEPNAFQLVYSFSVNYPMVIPEPPGKAERRKALHNLSYHYLDALSRIYGVKLIFTPKTIGESMEPILNMEKHPLEDYLLAIKNLPINKLGSVVAGFGMIIPEHLTNQQVRDYILHHISEYRNVITRPNNILPISSKITGSPGTVFELIDDLEHYTDFEIMEFFGYTGGFNNRNELILNIFEIIGHEGFMMFKDYDSNRTINTKTSLLTPLDEISRPYLVFGTPFEYRVLELDELIAGFRTENNQFHFHRSDSSEYTISQVSQLQTILPSMKHVNPRLSESIDQLLDKVKQGILMNLRTYAGVDQFKRELLVRDQEIKDKVEQILLLLFYAGMYMRRWRGPGHPYPNLSGQTTSLIDPEPQVIFVLDQCITLMDELKEDDPEIYDHLKKAMLVQYKNDQVVFLSKNLFDSVYTILGGKSCIRTYSEPVISGATYYLGVLFGRTVSSFDPYNVDPIG